MKTIQSLVISAALAIGMAAPASAGVNSPEVILYRVSGVTDTNAGVATSFFCTNFSGVDETIRFVVRGPGAALLRNLPIVVSHLLTIVVSTRDTLVYSDTSLETGAFIHGTAAIAATSVNVTCTAMQVQSNTNVPVGIALHMTRFNAIPGSEE